MSTLTPDIKELRPQLSTQHAERVQFGLVVWTAANVSARVPAHVYGQR